MIVVRVTEGLGNQMFQYAAGRALALRTGHELKLDLSWFENGPDDRPYALDAFEIEPDVVGAELRDTLRTLRSKGGPGRYPPPGDPVDNDYGLTLYRQLFPRFRPDVVAAPGGAYLCGWWQSEDYFADHADELRRSFTFRDPLSAEGRAVAEHFGACEAVAVHVRRGDYADNATIRGAMGLCSVEYYQRAVARIVADTDASRCFVFSDDPEWVRSELLPDLPDAVAARGATAAEDLRLMSLCRHHVIANSTFSWWAAWLAEHPDQVVVAPERWMRVTLGSTDRIVPERWLRL